jgi:hypothetical protein
MGIEEVIIAARSPWQLPYVERLIGSSHYHRWRCHQSLEMDCPEPRVVQPPEVGEVVEVREAGGLYRHYQRSAA